VSAVSAPYAARLRFGDTLALAGAAEPVPARGTRVSYPAILGYFGLAGAVDLNVMIRPAARPADRSVSAPPLARL
jgi:hypothetical protein